MATAAKKDEVSFPFVVLLLFLALAFVAGGLQGVGGGGGGRDRGGQSSGKDPCPQGVKSSKVIKSWKVDGRAIRLRCGTADGGYHHVKARHIGKNTDWRNVVECVGRTLTRGAHERQVSGRGVEDVYRWTYRAGKVATVRVLARTDDVITAWPGRGGSWAKCAGR